MLKLRWTLAALVGLGGVASAERVEMDGGVTTDEMTSVRGSQRGVAGDYLVLPSGGELTAQMKFVTAGPLFSDKKLEFTDLGLFGLTGRWSLFSKLELAASVDLLPKQPAYTDEKPWQSAGVTLRSPLGRRVAIALSGSGGHLLDHSGMWTREALMIEWKKPIDDEFLSFDVAAGIDGLGLASPDTTKSTAFITELSINTTALFRVPNGKWGGWVGIGYAVPVQASGHDPTTEIRIDPQPRLDFHMGTVLALVPKWDLFVDFAVVDRGELSDPSTRLPILDGGFDQRQVIFGVTRHIEAKPRPTYDDGSDSIRIGQL
jgi:hypothetical protein